MNQSPYILLLETSAEICSVALARADEVLKEMNHMEKNSHSVQLAPMVKELLDDLKLKPSDLGAVAISAGPGSYTGLRIGASLAKALCYSGSIPLIAVSSLKSLAFEMAKDAEANQLLCSMVDARRADVYYALFNKDLALIGEEEFTTLGPDFLAEHNGPILCGGSGSKKLAEYIELENVEIRDVAALASSMAVMAWKKYKAEEFEDLAYYEPNYIKAVHITSPKKNV